MANDNSCCKGIFTIDCAISNDRLKDALVNGQPGNVLKTFSLITSKKTNKPEEFGGKMKALVGEVRKLDLISSLTFL